jgi:hypothetical protein
MATGGRQPCTSDPKFSVIMLLNNNAVTRERLTVARARAGAQQAMATVLGKQASKATLRVLDWQLYSPRVTDVWLWRTEDAHAYHRLMADLRENQFWNRHCRIVETWVGVEETDVENYYREFISTRPDSGVHDPQSGTAMRDVA